MHRKIGPALLLSSFLVVIGNSPLLAQQAAQSTQDQQNTARAQQGERNRTAQPPSNRTGQAQAQNGQQQDLDDFSRVHIVSADYLVGRQVSDDDGDVAGQIEYLVIDPRRAKIMFALIGSGGLFDIGEDLRVVPWDNMVVRTWGEHTSPYISVDASWDDIKQSEKLTHDDIERLTDPQLQNQIINFYAPADQGGAASEQSGQTSGQQSQQQSGQTGGQQAQQQSGQTGGQQAQQQQQQQQQQSTGQRQQTAQQGSGQNQLILVGRQYISTLVQPPVTTQQQLSNANVRSSDGQNLGEIEKLVVDVDRGYISYAIVATGGFLGFGEELHPVPVNALFWSNQNTYVLPQRSDQLANMPTLVNLDLPDTVKRQDLERLYAMYSAQPYWNASEPGSASVGGSRQQ